MITPLFKKLGFLKNVQSCYLSCSPILAKLTNLEKIVDPKINKV